MSARRGRTQIRETRHRANATDAAPLHRPRAAGRHALRPWAVIGLAAVLLLTIQPVFLTSGPARGAHPAAESAVHGAAAELAAAGISAHQGNGPGAIVRPATPSPAATPNASYSIEMAYDAVDGYVIAVTPNVTGGLHNATYAPNDLTWKYAGGNWTILNTTGAPPELLWPALAYDTSDGYVVLFGGLQIAGSQGAVTQMVYSNQTWSFVSGVWTNQTSPTSVQPPADEPPIMTYDAADGYVLLLDEAVTAPQTMTPTTWAFHAGAWKNVSGPASGAAPPLDGVMAYDATDGYVVFFGGLTSGPGIENYTTIPATWTYSAGNWTNVTASTHGAPPGRIGAAMAYDPTRDAVVLFGGSTWNGPGTHALPNDTWAYSGGNWTNLSLTTPALSWYSLDMVYDGATQSLVLAGETNNSTNAVVTTSIWLLKLGTWTMAAPALFLVALGADVGTPFELSVVVGPHAGELTYAYTGLPAGCPSSDSSRLWCTARAPGEYRLQVTVTGGLGPRLNLSAVVTVHPAPEVLSFTSNLPVAEVGFPVELAATAAGGTGTLTFSYSGLPGGCASADAAALPCTPTAAGANDIAVNLTDSLGVTAGADLRLTVAARPSVTEFLVEPSVVDVGQTVVIVALSSGGVGPIQYEYGGLPVGCASTGALSFACLPTRPGSYELSLGATDSLGAQTGGTAALQVNAAPTIAGFAVSASRAVLGQALQFSAAVAGGTAPYTFVYSGLPGGCLSSDRTAIECTAEVPGNYSVVVVATDATGASVSQSVTVSVAPPTQHAGPLPLGGTGPSGATFWWGLALGLVGLAAAALWTRRELRNRREGESLVEGVVESNAPTDSGAHPEERTFPPPSRP